MDTIRRKFPIIIIVIAVLVAVLFAVIALVVRSGMAELDRLVKDRLHYHIDSEIKSINNITNDLRREARNVEEMVTRLGYHDKIVSGGVIANDDLIEKLRFSNQLNDLLAIYLLNTDGLCVFSTDASFLGKDYSFRPYFRRAANRSDTLYIAKGVTSGELGIYFSTPLLDTEGGLTGVIAIKLPLDTVTRYLTEMDKSGTFSALMTSDGVMIAGIENPALLSFTPLYPETHDRIMRKQQFPASDIMPLHYSGIPDMAWFKQREVIARDRAGEPYLIVFEKLDIGDLFYVYCIRYNTISSFLGRVYHLVFVVSGIFVLLIACIILGVILAWTREKRHNMIISSYQSLLESEGNGMCIVSRDGTCRHVNATACTLLATTADQIRDSNIIDILNEKTDAVFSEDMTQFWNEHVNANTQLTVRNHNGDTFISIAGIKLMDSAYLVVLHDITKLKIMLAKLRRSEKTLTDIIDFLPDPTLIIDSNRVVIFWNKALEQITGVPACEVIGKEGLVYREAIYGSQQTCLIDAVFDKDMNLHDNYKNITQENDTIIAETIAENPVTGKRDLWLKVCPIKDADGNIVAAIESIRDITAIKRMEQELLKTEKLESLGILAGGIAHDFNNILTSIMGNTSLLKLDATPQDEPLLNNIEAASHQAKGLSNQLLTFAKGGAPVKTVTGIIPVITDAAGFALKGSAIQIDYEMDDTIPAVCIDITQIGQVISNLVINAAQAMNDRGIITLRVSTVTVCDPEMKLIPGEYVRVSVTDSGTGISPGDQQRIFDPFFTTKETGSGLGLAICYSIVKKHFGIITVESQPGIGSTFHLYLPVSEESAKPEQHKHIQPSPSAGHTGKILILDDQHMVRETLAAMIAKFGYTAVYADTGEQAIQQYTDALDNGSPFDAVILDLTVPGGMGGRETIENLCQIDSGVIGILATGYTNDPIMADYTRYGFKGAIKKPFNMNDIQATLSSFLG